MNVFPIFKQKKRIYSPLPPFITKARGNQADWPVRVRATFRHSPSKNQSGVLIVKISQTNTPSSSRIPSSVIMDRNSPARGRFLLASRINREGVNLLWWPGPNGGGPRESSCTSLPGGTRSYSFTPGTPPGPHRGTCIISEIWLKWKKISTFPYPVSSASGTTLETSGFGTAESWKHSEGFRKYWPKVCRIFLTVLPDLAMLWVSIA